MTPKLDNKQELYLTEERKAGFLETSSKKMMFFLIKVLFLHIFQHGDLLRNYVQINLTQWIQNIFHT